MSRSRALSSSDSLSTNAEARDALEQKHFRGLRIVLALIFVLSVVCLGIGTTSSSAKETWVTTTVTLTSAIICLCTFLGIVTPRKALAKVLVSYLVVLLITAVTMAFFAGILLILNKDVVDVLATSDVELNFGSSEIDLTRSLYIIAGICIALTGLLFEAMRRISIILGELHSLVVILQTMNLMLLPFGLLSLAIGFFFADTISGYGTGIDFAATLFVGVGAILFCVTFIGCLASAVASRTLMAIYSVVLVILLTALLGGGISSLVLSTQVQQFVADEWATIRFGLPPTFVGRYDQVAFSNWLQVNLNVIGFIGIATGMFTAVMLVLSFSLRHLFLVERERKARHLDHVEENVTTLEELVQALSGSHGKGKGWMHATKKQRVIMKFVGVQCIFMFLVPIGLIQALYMYDTYCESIADISENLNFALDEPFQEIIVKNDYPIGFTELRSLKTVTNAIEASFDFKAAKEEYRSKQIRLGSFDDTTGIVRINANPSDSKEVLNRDISCQIGRLYIDVPTSFLFDATLPSSTTLWTNTTQSVKLDFANGDSSIQPFESTVMASEFGQVVFTGIGIGQLGGTFIAEYGGINIYDTATSCIVGDLSTVEMLTTFGSVNYENSVLHNCDLVIDSEAGPVELSSVAATTETGNGDSIISINDDKGTIKLTNVTSDWIRTTGTRGYVYASTVRVNKGFTVATSVGNVQIGEQEVVGVSLPDEGVIQIESTSGNVYVHISIQDGFFGRFTIDTGETRKVEILGVATTTNRVVTDASEIEDANTVSGLSVSGTINCEGNACNYGGEVIISSISGDVTLFVST